MECHRQLCERCAVATASRYNVSKTLGEPFLVCPECVALLRDAGSPTCDVCGDPEAYRGMAPGSRYLCIGCYGGELLAAVETPTKE